VRWWTWCTIYQLLLPFEYISCCMTIFCFELCQNLITLQHKCICTLFIWSSILSSYFMAYSWGSPFEIQNSKTIAYKICTHLVRDKLYHIFSTLIISMNQWLYKLAMQLKCKESTMHLKPFSFQNALWACYWATIHIHYFVSWMDQHENPPYLISRTISKNKVINIVYGVWR